MLRSLVLCCVGLGLLVTVAPEQAVAQGKGKHPRLHHALFELREARRELKEAGTNFGGHKAKAIKATDAAIRQIEECLRAVGEGVKGLEYGSDVYKKYKNYPHIRHAIGELREARSALQKAPRNFGGHRKEAVRAIDVAVEQLRLAIKFAKRS